MNKRILGPLFVDLMGETLASDEHRILRSTAVGGVILFSRNFSSLEQLSALTASIRQCRPELLICVDHEGGRVQRFRHGFTRIPAMQTLAQHESIIEDVAWLMGSELAAFGIDFSFAPVLDADDGFSAVIGDRSFSADPLAVCRYAKKFIRGLRQAGLPAIGKHFPGHGGVRADSHLELPVDTRSLRVIEQHDLLPFRNLLPELDGLMPAHILFSEVDDAFPVGYSKTWLQSILRRQWQFQGVIFSDDLSMKGAESEGGFSGRARLALAAGCDAILVCNNRAAVEEVISFLESQGLSSNSARLERMRCQRFVTYRELQGSDRWRSARAALDTIAID